MMPLAWRFFQMPRNDVNKILGARFLCLQFLKDKGIMPQELKEEFTELAKKTGWRKPNHAFIAFKCKKAELLSSKDSRETEIETETGLRTYETIVNFNVAGVHRQVDKLEKIIRKKKFEVVAWGNFPKPESTKAKMTRSSSEDLDDWTKLDNFLVGLGNRQEQENKTIRGLQAKVQELEAKQQKKGA